MVDLSTGCAVQTAFYGFALASGMQIGAFDLIDIENVVGGLWDDRMTAATAAADGSGGVLDGSDGNDLVFGKDGDDTLTGGRGDDRIYGAEGDDILTPGLAMTVPMVGLAMTCLICGVAGRASMWTPAQAGEATSSMTSIHLPKKTHRR